MKIHRFFVKDLGDNYKEGQVTSLTDQAVIHQVKNVLRLQENNSLVLLDNFGKEYFIKIISLKKDSLDFVIESVKKHEQNFQKINLYFSIPKKDKAELVVQKCTELGVQNFYPIISDRTEKNNLNKERMNLIIKEASEQSEKFFLPNFNESQKLSDVLEKINHKETFYLDIIAEKINIEKIKKESNINIFVGPEGGWSENDKKLFEKFNIKKYSLGDFVLRTETASIAIASAIQIN